MPSGRKIKPQAVNVRKGTRGLCEISVALEGGSEAYGLRDQVQGGDPTLGSRGCPIILQNRKLSPFLDDFLANGSSYDSLCKWWCQ